MRRIYHFRLIITYFILMLCFCCEAQEERLVEEIPFRLIDDAIYIKGSIDGYGALNFLFDTGASITLIGKNVGRELGLKNGYVGSNTGAAGTSTVTNFPNHDVQLGSTVFKGLTIVEDHKDLTTYVLGEALDGIIGADILNNVVVEIDYDRMVISLYPIKSFHGREDYQKMDIDLRYGVPLTSLSFSLDGKTFTGRFVVDTGYNGTMALTTPFANKNRIEDLRGKFYDVSAVLGSTTDRAEMYVTKADAMSLGKESFEDIVLVVSRATKGILASDLLDGVLGNEILKRFNIIYDYARSKMYIKPNGLLNVPFVVNCSGISLDKSDSEKRLFVKELSHDSPASVTDLKPGDEIISVNGQAVTSLVPGEIDLILSKPDTLLKLKVKRAGELLDIEVMLRNRL